MAQVSQTANGYKHILVREATYFALKQLGQAGDSFDKVITNLIKEKKERMLQSTRTGQVRQTACPSISQGADTQTW